MPICVVGIFDRGQKWLVEMGKKLERMMRAFEWDLPISTPLGPLGNLEAHCLLALARGMPKL
jgi:hypothetical protein